MIRHLGFLLGVGIILSGSRYGRPRIAKCSRCEREDEPTYADIGERRVCRLCIELGLAQPNPYGKGYRPDRRPLEVVPAEHFEVPASWLRQFSL